MKWKMVKLGEVVTLEYGKALKEENRDSSGAIPVYSSAGVVGSHSASLSKAPTIVVGRKGTAGSVHYSEKAVWVIDTAYWASFDHNVLHPRYLYYQLQLLRLPELAKHAAIPGLSRTDVYDKTFSLPPLPIQQKIAALLDAADAVRQKDKALLAKYDALLQSTFHHLFGDPVRNEKGWEVVTIRDLVSAVNYGTSKPAEEEGSYPYLRMNNITYSGDWDFTSMKHINLSSKEEDKYLVRKGDLLFNRTNSKDLVGKTAVYDSDIPMAIAGYLIRVRTNEKANAAFISAFLNSNHGKTMLKAMCKSIVGMANINAQELQDIQIPIPPLSLQTHFARIARNIQRQKALVKEAAAKSEALFQSLLHQAFHPS